MWWSRSAFRPTTPERIDELFAGDTVPPAIVVLTDAWTSLGGSQYLNSPGTGRYLDYLCDEIVPFVDERYATLPSREHRGVTGKSSGGYGAMVVPMLRPDVFGALASHAGDALFELCYLPDVVTARVHQEERPLPAEHLLHGGLLLGRAGRHRHHALRPGQREAPRRRVAALAGGGPGAHGRRARRRPALDARDLPGRRQERRVEPGRRCRRLRRGAGPDRRPVHLRAVRRRPRRDRVPLPDRPRVPGRAPAPIVHHSVQRRGHRLIGGPFHRPLEPPNVHKATGLSLAPAGSRVSAAAAR